MKQELVGTYRMYHVGYCGMTTVEEKGDGQDMRREVAALIRKMRRDGYAVTTLDLGERWEVLEPDDCMMVPDECGIIKLIRVPRPDCFYCGCEWDREDGCSCQDEEEFDGCPDCENDWDNCTCDDENFEDEDYLDDDEEDEDA